MVALWGVQNNGEGVQENLLRVMGMVYVWVGIWVAWMLAFAKNDQTLTLNIWVFCSCKLFLNQKRKKLKGKIINLLKINRLRRKWKSLFTLRFSPLALSTFELDDALKSSIPGLYYWLPIAFSQYPSPPPNLQLKLSPALATCSLDIKNHWVS